jgi:small subunit ribosomal protein S6e
MVEFKVVVNDTKNGKSHQVQVSGHHANSLIGKKIGDEVDGIFVSLPGYKLQITGGTDKDGFTMRADLPGMGRRKLLLSESRGFIARENGMRKKKSVRGNTINQDIVQINMKVVKFSSRPIEKLIKIEEKSGADKAIESKDTPTEIPKEEPKEEVKKEGEEEQKEDIKEEQDESSKSA